MAERIISAKVPVEIADKVELLGLSREWGSVDAVVTLALSIFLGGAPRTGPGIVKLLARLDARLETHFRELRSAVAGMDHELYRLNARLDPCLVPEIPAVPEPSAEAQTAVSALPLEALLQSDEPA